MGFGAVFGQKWTYGIWPQTWHDRDITRDITVLELFPIFVCLVVWGDLSQNKTDFFSFGQSECGVHFEFIDL